MAIDLNTAKSSLPSGGQASWSDARQPLDCFDWVRPPGRCVRKATTFFETATKSIPANQSGGLRGDGKAEAVTPCLLAAHRQQQGESGRATV